VKSGTLETFHAQGGDGGAGGFWGAAGANGSGSAFANTGSGNVWAAGRAVRAAWLSGAMTRSHGVRTGHPPTEVSPHEHDQFTHTKSSRFTTGPWRSSIPNPDHGTMLVGVRRPKRGETTEQVIAEYSPALWWAETGRSVLRTFPSASPGRVRPYCRRAIPKPEPHPEDALAIWRENVVISQLQAHYMLKVWGLYDQGPEACAIGGRSA